MTLNMHGVPSTKHSLYYNDTDTVLPGLVQASRVSKQQAKWTHISVYLSTCPPPPSDEVTFWV